MFLLADHLGDLREVGEGLHWQFCMWFYINEFVVANNIRF